MYSTIWTVLLGLVIASAIAVPATLPKSEIIDQKSTIDSLLSTKVNTIEDKFSIENWHSPPEIVKKFPYYLSGYDEEDRPIGVIELGKWDAGTWSKRGKEAWIELEHHAEKMLYILKSGIHAKTLTENNVTRTVTDELVLVVDWDGFKIAQATNPKVLSFMIKYIGQLEILQDRIAHAYFINVTPVANAVVRLLKPSLGRAFERVEMFGTQKSKWIPVLRRNLPVDQIPEKYGGRAGHEPLVFYG